MNTRVNEGAARLDSVDPLRGFRDEFHLPRDAAGAPLVYFAGHSLGLQPRAAGDEIDAILRSWERRGVEGHFSGEHPWVDYHERARAGLALLTGAQESEVVAMNSLSVNLHLLLTSFYRPNAARCKILIERNAFPSDRYAVRSHLQLHGFDPDRTLLELAPREGEFALRHDDICDVLERQGATIATVLLPGVQYLTGQCLDIASIAALARKQGCYVGFDLAHAIGNTPLALHDNDVDFAVWCSYKYLNAGPGAIGGAFVHERHARAFDLPRLAGWWGHDAATRFAMPDRFAPLAGADGWQVSNPPILSMAPLLASLAIFARAGIERLRAKSCALSDLLDRELRARLRGAITILTPADARGAQLSIKFNVERAQLERIRDRLATGGIVCDWREPDVLRVAPVPLYNTFAEVARFVDVLAETLA